MSHGYVSRDYYERQAPEREKHAALVAELIAADDLEALADHLAELDLSPRQEMRKVFETLAALPEPARVRLLRASLAAQPRAYHHWYVYELIYLLIAGMKTGFGGEDVDSLLAYEVRAQGGVPTNWFVHLVRWRHGTSVGISAEVKDAVRLRAVDDPEVRQFAAELFGHQVRPGDPWADRILADLPGLDEGWHRLVEHAGSAVATRPPAKWKKEATGLIAALDPDRRDEILTGWVSAGLRSPTGVPDTINADTLRGLLWLLELTPVRADTVRLLGALVETMLRKLPGVGPACPKVANAAVGVLARLDGETALAQLARLSGRITYKTTLGQINKALDARAAALGLSREDIDELAVPTYGLSDAGTLTAAFGPCRAELAIRGSAAVVTWYAESGRQVKTAPAAVRRDHPDRVNELKGTAKDISAMLSAQAQRLDKLFVSPRVWPVAAWRDRYLDHPVLGTLARRLIWLVDGVACGYADAALLTVTDTEVTVPAQGTVELWHPIGRPVAEVIAWRDWLERHGVVQPFKQAHREVYLLTPAEEATDTYSNRFAGHILRQHQFHALAAARGWSNKLRLMVDDSYPPPSRYLPHWGVRVEFWVEGAGDNHQTDTTDAGTYLRLATDQVRFYPIDAPQNWAHANGGHYSTSRWAGTRTQDDTALSLDKVPPLLFSEIMRDIDLFVGVASVGNDPTWADGGPEGRFRDYWHTYSFGDLSATAETRRDLLVRLLPRLAIGDRATIDGRFLVVRGDVRNYKIHLGSGNILMSPNDAYLCIVADQGADAATPSLLLPFEGDGVLAMILSKAMLLAKDSKISDPTITRQLAVQP